MRHRWYLKLINLIFFISPKLAMLRQAARLKKLNLSASGTIRRSRGFSLITAVFILIVLASVSGFAVSIAGIIHNTTSLVRQGEVAYFAARSGLEWGMYKVTSNPTTCPATTTLSLTQGAFTNFTVRVSCVQSSITEGNINYNIFSVNAVAERGAFGTPDYISREMSVTTTIG